MGDLDLGQRSTVKIFSGRTFKILSDGPYMMALSFFAVEILNQMCYFEVKNFDPYRSQNWSVTRFWSNDILCWPFFKLSKNVSSKAVSFFTATISPNTHFIHFRSLWPWPLEFGLEITTLHSTGYVPTQNNNIYWHWYNSQGGVLRQSFASEL